MEVASLSIDELYKLLPNYSKNEIAYCVLKIKDEDIFNATILNADDNPLYIAIFHGLTYKGNDFLNSIRNQSKWEKIKSYMKKNAIPFVISEIYNVVKSKFFNY